MQFKIFNIPVSDDGSAMDEIMPESIKRVSGIGDKKSEKYGKRLVEMLQAISLPANTIGLVSDYTLHFPVLDCLVANGNEKPASQIGSAVANR